MRGMKTEFDNRGRYAGQGIYHSVETLEEMGYWNDWNTKHTSFKDWYPSDPNEFKKYCEEMSGECVVVKASNQELIPEVHSEGN